MTGIGQGPNESRPLNSIAFFAFFLCLGLGIPLACAIAILKYRLYDLDIVVKRTVVFTIVAAFITVLYLAALALAAVSTFGALVAAVVFVLTFNPVRRQARSIADRVVYGKRATPFEVLSEFSERLGETYSIDDVLPRMAQLLATSTSATEVRVWLLQDRELSVVAAWPADLAAAPAHRVIGGELPAFGEDVHASAVTHQGELLGAITLSMPAKDPMDASKQRLITGLAAQAGLALRNVRLVRDLRTSRRRIVTAQDERAKRLERNIHDGAQQQLVALAVQLKLAEQMVDRDPDKARALLGQLQGAAGAALEDLRDLARGIYPPLLADKGLAVALEAQARKAAVPVTVEAEEIGRFSQEVEATVYFCTLEALNNVAKYADAQHANVRIANGDATLRFEVRDDGAGFDPAVIGYGTGLQGMADRLAALGGELHVTSTPGAGTMIEGEQMWTETARAKALLGQLQVRPALRSRICAIWPGASIRRCSPTKVSPPRWRRRLARRRCPSRSRPRTSDGSGRTWRRPSTSARWRRSTTSRSTPRRPASRYAWPTATGASASRWRTTALGFDPSAIGYGTGLQGMADRLAAVGGELTRHQRARHGTTIEGRLPAEARP